MTGEKDNIVDESEFQKETEVNFDNFSDIVNTLMGALINMVGELNNTRSEIALDRAELKDFMKNSRQRITDIEELKHKQLLATDEQLQKINQMEHEGMELTGVNLTASILGTMNLIYEILGKTEVQVGRTDERVNVVNQRITETLMEMKVIKEQQTNVIAELSDLKQESIRLREQDKKTMVKMLSIFTVIFIILASLAGIQTFLNAFRGI